MAANQPPWPREWLMTDERIGELLWPAIDAMPAGAGIVFRHHATPSEERADLAGRIANLCHGRGLILAVSRDTALAGTLGAALVHNPAADAGKLPFSRSAHGFERAMQASTSGASLIFLSPIHPTRSHPGQQALQREEVRRIIAACEAPLIALGGMNRARFAQIEGEGFYGWAGIDAWLGARIRT